MKTPLIKRCENCQENFNPKNNRKATRFCGNSCRGKWQYKHGKNLPPKRNGTIPWNKGLDKYTDSKIAKMSRDRTGEKNWAWKSGVTKRFRDNHKRQLIIWRKAVYERDNYTCKSCGKRGGKLHPHHIIPVAECRSLALEINNGVTMCVRCHIDFHILQRIMKVRLCPFCKDKEKPMEENGKQYICPVCDYRIEKKT